MPTALDFSFLRDRTTRRRVGAVSPALVVVGAASAFLAPPWYRAAVSVSAAKPAKASVSGMLGGDLAELASVLDVGGLGGSETPRIAAVLQSTAVSDAVIERFRLKERYSERYQETAREELWRHCEVQVLAKPSIVQLSC